MISTRGRISHPVWSFLPVLVLNALVGPLVYWFCLFVAYYEDPIGWSDHLMFLAPIAVFAVLTGFVVLFSAAWEPEAMVGQLFAFGILSSLALNATTVGIGSIVSGFNTSVRVTVASFAAATVFANAARRTTAAA